MNKKFWGMHKYLQFSKTGQETRSICFVLSILFTQAKLYCEPVTSGQLFDVLIRCSERCESDLLREARKTGVCKKRSMTQKLMADIGFRGIKRFWRMADVLSRMEDPKCESSEEISRTQETSDRSQYESSCISQKVWDVLELRYVVRSVSTVCDHQWEYVVVFFACMFREKFRQLIEYNLPCVDFFLCILHSRNGLTTAHKGVKISLGEVNANRKLTVCTQMRCPQKTCAGPYKRGQWIPVSYIMENE